MLRAVMILWAALTFAAPAAAQTAQREHEATIAAATAYLDAYQAFDLERLEALYAEDATFDDPTSLLLTGVNGAPFVFRGRDAILNGIRFWMQNSVTSLRYDVEEIYESSGRVVFIGAATANGPSRWRFRIVTIVTIENGLVVEHRDYTDYWGANQVQPTNP